MRKYGKVLFVLAVLAAVPAVVSADGSSDGQQNASVQKQKNQERAEQVASALRNARVDGYDIEIEVKDDLVTLGGKVRKKDHRSLAASACREIAGVLRVRNNLEYVPEHTRTQSSQTTEAFTEAATFEESTRATPVSQQVEFSQPAAPAVSNQQIAQQIGMSLSQVGLAGYPVEIRYQDGVAILGGSVATADQRAAAAAAASRIPGVSDVQNQLEVTGPIAQTAHAQPMYSQPAFPQAAPAGYPQQVRPASMAAPAAMGASPAAMGLGGGHGAYSNPHLPDHAWPAYAQYPNSAAVTYPTQYSASAFPYIGPFYPYPQVPLDSREARLEWDDGFWHLNFNEKKDAWHWLFSPKNW